MPSTARLKAKKPEATEPNARINQAMREGSYPFGCGLTPRVACSLPPFGGALERGYADRCDRDLRRPLPDPGKKDLRTVQHFAATAKVRIRDTYRCTIRTTPETMANPSTKIRSRR